MSKNQKIVAITIVLYVLSAILDVYMNVIKNQQARIVTKPLTMFAIGVYYFVAAKKINFWVVLSLVTSVVSDVLYMVREHFFELSLIFFVITNLIYIKLLWKDMQKHKLKNFYQNTLVFGILVFVVYYIVIRTEITSYKIVLLMYIISTCIWVSIAFTNYLYKMSKDNMYLFIGVFAQVVSDVIYSTYIFDFRVNYFLFAPVISLYYVAHYFIYKGFALKSYEEKVVEA